MNGKTQEPSKCRNREMVIVDCSFVSTGGAGNQGTIKGLGIKSVTRGATAGLYNIVLDDSYPRVLSSLVSVEQAVPAPWTQTWGTSSVNSPAGAGTMTFTNFVPATGVATDFPAGVIVKLELRLQNTGVFP